jgi:hypothetical protein
VAQNLADDYLNRSTATQGRMSVIQQMSLNSGAMAAIPLTEPTGCRGTCTK